MSADARDTAVTSAKLCAHDCDNVTYLLTGVTHIKWITDKESGQFYGSSFVEMANVHAAARAVAMDGQKLLGRPLKVFV